MSSETQEIIRLCEALPKDKRSEVVDFARFLVSQMEHPDDTRWEQVLADRRARPKLEAFVQESAAEGGEEPLDPRRL